MIFNIQRKNKILCAEGAVVWYGIPLVKKLKGLKKEQIQRYESLIRDYLNYYLDKNFGFVEFRVRATMRNSKAKYSIKYDLFKNNQLCNEQHIRKFIEKQAVLTDTEIQKLHAIQRYAIIKAFKQHLTVVLSDLEKQIVRTEKDIINLLNKIVRDNNGRY